MLDDSDIFIPGANNAVVPKPFEMYGNDRWSLKEKKAFVELDEMTSMKKKDSAMKKEADRLSKIHLKKVGSGHVKDPTLKKPKEEESEVFKGRNVRKTAEVGKIAKKGKNDEKFMQETPPKTVKAKAFGTTFYKTESEITNTKPLSSSGKFGRCSRNRSREVETTEDEFDEYLTAAKFSSRRKTPDDGEDGGRVKTKGVKSHSMQRIGSDGSLQDGKTNDGKKANKSKVITAFGSTFRKTENDTISLPKKKATFTDRLTRSKSTKLKTVDGTEIEDGVGAKANIQKNKLMDMVEESGKSRVRSRGPCPGKRTRSPYQTSTEFKANLNKVRVEGDAKQDERAEIGKEMSFFEKIQQNVRAYFSARSPEMAKYEEEKQPVQEGEKRRPTSFHRSKSLQKNALAEPTSESSTSVGLTLEPGEQVQDNPSAYRVASAFAQVQEFHQEITRRITKREMSVLVQEESLTPIVTCLPGDAVPEGARWESGQAGNCRSRSRLTRNRYSAISRKHPEDLHATRRKIRSSRSEGTLYESNATVRFAADGFQRGDIPRQTVTAAKKTCQPDKRQFAPRKTRWFVYSLTETAITDRSLLLLPPPPPPPPGETFETGATAASTADEGTSESDEKHDQSAPGSNKKKEPTPSFTLKDIISLTRKVFQENDEGKQESAAKNEEVIVKSIDPSLGHHLEKLMDEKKNYLNLQKTKNFRKTQKVDFIADSFNFFNLLNKEFLSVKTFNPSIDKLRNVIVENQNFNMEEYLNMYKKVIKTSLTEPELGLMDRVEVDLERYADMYYDLMKYICMEKERKNAEKTQVMCSNPSGSPKSGNGNRANYYEILKQGMRRNVNRNVNWGNAYLDRIKPRSDRSLHAENIQKRTNTGRTTYRTSNPRKGIEKEQKLITVSSGPDKVKQVVELLSPPKSKGATLRKDTETTSKVRNDQGKVLLTISVCNGSLIIKQATEPANGVLETTTESAFTNSTGLLESSEEDGKNKSAKPLQTEDKRSRSRNSVSETNLGAAVESSSDEVEKTQSELLLRTESDVTVYSKSSVDEEIESSESRVEHPMFKFRAFRKLINEGLKYLTSFGESMETEEEHDCPKIPKGGKVPEIQRERISYPKAKICVKGPTEKETKKLGECKPDHQKNSCLRDVRQIGMRDRGSPVSPKMNEAQEDRKRKTSTRNVSPLPRGVSPSKPGKKESSGEEDAKGKKAAAFWWRNDRNHIKNASPTRPRTQYRSPVKKSEGTALANRTTLSKTQKQAEATSVRGTSRCGERKPEKAPKKVEQPKLQDSRSDYATPTGSYFEWQFGLNSLKYLLNEMPPTLLNPEAVNVGKPNAEEAEEKELRKLDLSCEDEANRDNPAQTTSNASDTRQKSPGPRGNNSLRQTDWDLLLQASYRKDYRKVSQVLNQFMGNISEAWKAAMYLRDFIRSKSVEEPPRNSQEEKTFKNLPVESFRNFLQILTKVFEDNQEETSLRRELFLVMKEVLELSTATPSVKAVLNEIPYTGNRTIFYREIAEIPLEVRQLVAEELISRDKIFSRREEDYEPGSFVSAVKDVGEKLKVLYLAEREEVEKPEEVSKEVTEKVPKPKKIYYRPRKKNVPEGTTIRRNLRSLAEKLNQISEKRKSHTERESKGTNKAESGGDPKCLRKVVRTQSSTYFDAQDRFQQSDNGNTGIINVNTVDESYFSGKTFGKHQDLIFDRIIAFLKSDNPHNISCGLALLGKMMEENRQPTNDESFLFEEEQEKKWYDLVDKIMDMCHVIESEMKEQMEKRLATENEQVRREESELARTREHLKKHVDSMKVVTRETKEPEGSRQHGRDSTAKVQALEESRQTNMERRLKASSDLTATSPYHNQKYLDNVVAFINSIDKFSKGLLSTWFGKNPLPEESHSREETKDASDSVLESNKAVLMSLRKNIDKRQKKIQEMIDQVEKDGMTREELFADERLTRKVRDLKKCYNLLEKMIYDPTMLPPKCFRMTENADGELFERKVTPERSFQVMTALQGTAEEAKETRLIRYSRSNASIPSKKDVFQQLPVGLFSWFHINTDLGFDLPVKGQGHDEDLLLIQRPRTA